MSQGYIGYHLQQAIQFELKSRKLERQAVSVITQVVVDKEDKAFQTPVKPIGMFYTKQEADRMEKEQGFVFAEDAGRGYRRVVCIHYKKENQQELTNMTVSQARTYIQQGHFAPGSMLPKVEACLSFVEQTKNGTAIITSLDCAKEALLGKTGTKIVND